MGLGLAAHIGLLGALVSWPCLVATRALYLLANRSQASLPPALQDLSYAAAWSAVLSAVAALAAGTVNMSGAVDAVVCGDIIQAWGIGLGALWLVIEPFALALLAAAILALKQCTTFDDIDHTKRTSRPPAHPPATAVAPVAAVRRVAAPAVAAPVPERIRLPRGKQRRLPTRLALLARRGPGRQAPRLPWLPPAPAVAAPVPEPLEGLGRASDESTRAVSPAALPK